ncbi:MAG: WD40/YVTN/BNR-like repeat-containing protein [Candidatus Dormibacteria bacterium]
MAVFRRALAALVAAVALPLAIPLLAGAADNQWSEYGALPGSAPAFSVVTDPANPAAVIAATQGAGLVRSDDGKSWHDIGAGVLPKYLWRVATDDSRGSGGFAPLYVGSAGHGFYRSLDGGRSWKEGNSGLSGAALNVRAIGLGRGVIFVGTSNGVFKSSDGGSSWTPAGLAGYEVGALAFAQYSAPTVVIAGIDGARSPGSRIVRSNDLGVTWAPLKGIPADMVVSNLAAGTPPPSPATLRPLFAAGSGGVLKSDDGGDNWAQLAGLPAQGFSALATSPYDANTVYAASDNSANGGVWRSTDRGNNWAQVGGAQPSQGMAEKMITALSLNRSSPGGLVAMAFNPDRPAVIPYVYNDTQAPLTGTPEGGVCPSASACAPGDPDPFPATTAAAPSPEADSVIGPICGASPTPSPPSSSPTPSAPRSPGSAGSSPAATASASASATPSPSPVPCRNLASPRPPKSSHSDLPLNLAWVVVGALMLLLLGRVVSARR